MNRSYEVMSYREGRWTIVNMTDSKEDALHEAKMQVESKHQKAVVVLEENTDGQTGVSNSSVIFKEGTDSENIRLPGMSDLSSKPKDWKSEPAKGNAGKNNTKPKKRAASKEASMDDHISLIFRKLYLLVFAMASAGLVLIAAYWLLWYVTGVKL